MKLREEKKYGQTFYSCDEKVLFRKRRGEISSRAYNLIIGGVLLWGFVVNALMCAWATDFFMSLNPVAVLVGYFVLAIIGILMSKVSINPVISFIGYNLVVLPVGVVLSILLTDYEAGSILNTCIVTAVVTAIMVVLAAMKPDIFLSMGKTLFICLTAVIVIELIALLFGIYMPTWWDLIVALIFCGYIGYDWAEAQQEDKTVDNAIDSCVGLYLDIINLFIRVLSASGNRKSSD